MSLPYSKTKISYVCDIFYYVKEIICAYFCGTCISVCSATSTKTLVWEFNIPKLCIQTMIDAAMEGWIYFWLPGVLYNMHWHHTADQYFCFFCQFKIQLPQFRCHKNVDTKCFVSLFPFVCNCYTEYNYQLLPTSSGCHTYKHMRTSKQALLERLIMHISSCHYIWRHRFTHEHISSLGHQKYYHLVAERKPNENETGVKNQERSNYNTTPPRGIRLMLIHWTHCALGCWNMARKTLYLCSPVLPCTCNTQTC